jgi:exopolysaccharide biosynthesis predicted pyruvyltransferase EpsI
MIPNVRRNIENIKVWCRERKELYNFLKIIYFPIVIIKKIYDALINYKITLEALKNISNIPTNKNRIFYFGIPVHKNLGDSAQMYCINLWISENFPDYHTQRIKTGATYSKIFRRKLKNIIKQDDIIIIQSGATFSSKHFDHKMHNYLISTFVDNRILMLPQTIGEFNEEDLNKTISIFNKHKRLLFLARDQVSYNYFKDNFIKTKVLLYPDIVTCLIGSYQFNEPREGILLCKRIDGEKAIFDKDLYDMKQKLTNFVNIWI